MFSLDRFYNTLHSNFVQPLDGQSYHFYPFGTYDNLSFLARGRYNPRKQQTANEPKAGGWLKCYFFDQEPLFNLDPVLSKTIKNISDHPTLPKKLSILANSEISEQKTQYCRSYSCYDWYYFFHGFAALDWYRDFQYVNPSSFNRFDKVFICYNHLISKYRSYRLHLVANLIEQDLLKHGHVSLFLNDNIGTWQEAIEDPENPLDNRARVKIYQALKNINEPLTIDTHNPDGTLSADINLDDLTSALFSFIVKLNTKKAK